MFWLRLVVLFALRVFQKKISSVSRTCRTHIASSFFFQKNRIISSSSPTPFLFSLSTLNSCFLAFPNRKSSEFAPRFHRLRTLLFNR
ncbi:hypothetical protein Hanom_Chr12g01127821 [Helianthus anomalus]